MYDTPLASGQSEGNMRLERQSWPIIVGGCHRSGTSLLRRVLNAHPRIFCGPEIKFFRDFQGQYLGDPIRHARFFRSAQAISPREELLEVFGQAYISLLERAAARAGKLRWADKNPENVLNLREWELLLKGRWLFVQAVRHPLDTLASIKETRFPFVIPAELEARIDFYRQYTKAGLEFGEQNPDRYVLVRYEELARSPQQTLERLMAWAGESFEPVQLCFNSVPQQTGLEDPKVGRTTQIHTDSIGRWRNQLSREDATLIWERTQELWSRIERADVDPFHVE